MSTPSCNSVRLSLLGQSIQLGLMSPCAHTHMCSCVAFPWQHQCETHSPLSTVPLICISFAWFCKQPVAFDLAMANKLPWPRQSLSVCCPPHIISLLDIMSVIASCHPFHCHIIFPDFQFLFSPPLLWWKHCFRVLSCTSFSLSSICKHFPSNHSHYWTSDLKKGYDCLLFCLRTHNFILSATLPSFTECTNTQLPLKHTDTAAMW